MNKILFILLFLFLLIGCQRSIEPMDTTSDEEVIKSIEFKSYNMIKDEKLIHQNKLQIYDKKGDLIIETAYNQKGEAAAIKEFETEYNKDGNVIRKATYENDKIIWETKYIYKGENLVKYESYNNGELSMTSTYTYDGEDKFETTTGVGIDSFSSEHIKNEDGTTSYYNESKREDGFYEIYALLDVDDNPLEYILNKDGNKTEENYFDYEDNYKKQTITVIKSEIKWVRNISVKDEYDNVLDMKLFDENGNVVFHYLYEYEYDDNGNWTIKSYYRNGVKITVEERKIEYYN